MSVSILNLDGTTTKYDVYNVNTFPYEKLSKIACKSTKQLETLNTFATYDIEASSLSDGGSRMAWMYHWQMCVGGYVCCGRYWDDWTSFLKKIVLQLELNENRRMIIFVHNLGYEYQFMKHLLREMTDFDVFAPQKRKPLVVRCHNGLEFRCSWKLTNMSLEKACQFERGVKTGKQSGDLDYRKVRTPETILTEKELGYCVADVVSLYQLIECRMKNHGDDLNSIPLTSTSYVRRDVRKSCKSDKRYRELFLGCAMNKKVYGLLKEAGRGGDTHANRYMSGKILKGVDAYDVQSSYPYVLMCKYFPMTQFTPYGHLDSKEEFNELLEEYCCLFRIVLCNVNVHNNVPFPYIAEDKCLNLVGATLDNGRVLHADLVCITITELDYQILREQYDWDENNIYIGSMHIAERGDLPKCIKDPIMAYFRAKTELKYYKSHPEETDLTDIGYYYDRSKNSLNGIFGMMYTDPVHKLLEEAEDGTWREAPQDVGKALEKFYKSRNSFLVYAWGIWTTAHARSHLANLVKITNPQYAAYCDTDSCYTLSSCREIVAAYNKQIMAEAESHGAYADAGGKRYHMGIYELDKECRRFKTLGAKKYAYEDEEGLHVTVSGVQKEGAPQELGRLENFIPGFTFVKCGGLDMYYLECGIHDMTINGCTFKTASSICSVDGTYELGITGEYAELLGYNIYNDIEKSWLYSL